MKIIHCADLHLDSKMTSNLSKEQAKERKMEILRTYSRMIEYAKNNDVKAIIIAGDLFDTRNVSATARNLVKDSITSNPTLISESPTSVGVAKDGYELTASWSVVKTVSWSTMATSVA